MHAPDPITRTHIFDSDHREVEVALDDDGYVSVWFADELNDHDGTAHAVISRASARLLAQRLIDAADEGTDDASH